EIAAGRLRKGELERAKENLKGRIVLSLESTSNRMSRLGKSIVTATELLSLERVIEDTYAAEADHPGGLPRGGHPSVRAPGAGGGGWGEGGRRTGEVEPRRAGRGVKSAFFGGEGKAGGAVVRGLEAGGHEVNGIELGEEPDVAGCDAAVDFKTPDAVPANIRA